MCISCVCEWGVSTSNCSGAAAPGAHVSACQLCMHVPTGNMCSALLMVGPGGMDPQQFHLCQATGFALPAPPLVSYSISFEKTGMGVVSILLTRFTDDITYSVIWSNSFYILITEQWAIMDHSGDKASSKAVMPNLSFSFCYTGTVLYLLIWVFEVNRIENMLYKLQIILFAVFYA